MNKKIIFLSGVPGSGKSTYARKFSNATVCSADDFFINEETGEYEFNPAKIAEAHAECMAKFIFALSQPSVKHIILDNTNIETWQWVNYENIATISGNLVDFPVHHVAFKCTTFAQAKICAERNTHSVPVGVILDMAYRHQIPTNATVYEVK